MYKYFEKSGRVDVYGEKLSKMIQKETISFKGQQDREKFYAFHTLLEELFPEIHKKCKKRVFDGSLLYEWQGGNKKDSILLMSHMDVVPATGEWIHDPFGGHIDEEGRIWGRGSIDTKSSLFCILQAIEELISNGFEPERTIYMASSCTEEWAGDGAPKIAEFFIQEGIQLSLVLDEGGMIIDAPFPDVDGNFAMLGIAEKGYADLRFIARSRGGHAALPGKNSPLVRLGRFMSEVDAMELFNEQTSDVAELFVKRILEKAKNPNRTESVIRSSSFFKSMLQSSIAFTMAKGSDQSNILPVSASVIGNMRTIHHQSNESCKVLLKELANKHDIEMEVLYEHSPTSYGSMENLNYKCVEKSLRLIYPDVIPCPYIMAGGTDSRYFEEISSLCIRIRPLYATADQRGAVHGINENIFKWALPKGVDFYKIIIQKC